MKFLIVFSVLALCAINVNGTFSKHFHKGGKAESTAAVETSASSSSGGHGGGGAGLASLGKILAIPLGIKQKLLLSHQKKINQKFDKIIGALSKFGSHGSKSGGNAGAGEIALNGNGHIEGNVNGGSQYQSESSEYSGGSVQTQSGIGLSAGGGGSFGGQYDSGITQDYSQNYNGGAVQSYQPQPAVQSYQPQPAVHNYHPQPAAQTQYKEVPVTVQLFQVDAQPQAPVIHQRFEPEAPVVQHYEPIPAAPIVHQTFEPQAHSSSYGSSEYQSSAPIVEKQVIQEVGNAYLPPHAHQPGCSH
jgi:hypothetical protein